MELIGMTDRIWYSMYEAERDRPSLGYIRGDDWSLVVDAGHSAAHTGEFYEALRKANLPLPDLTVITHWHWDHSFGMHKIHGLSAANGRTNAHLKAFAEKIRSEGVQSFLSMDPSIRKEYAGGEPVVIVPADIVFEESLSLDLGGVCVKLSTCASPHTDDTTLVLVPEERVLFVGDCISGVFPTWERDPEETKKLMGVLERAEADRFIGGHWPVFTKEQLPQMLGYEE